jgi:tripeptide aminopeptidase
MVNEQRLLDLFLRMIRVNTPARHEKVLVDEIQEHLESLGVRCVRDDAHTRTGGDSGNLIATIPGNVSGAPSIFFSSHFDTVEPTPDIQIVMEDGIIRTDGTTILGGDDKGGMAPILEAVQVLLENNLPHGEIQLLLTVSEEIGLRGAHEIDRSLVSARMGFVLDTGPPVGTVVYTAPTQDTMDVTITGRPAHAGFEPEKGLSAIQVAARAIERMRQGRIDPETTSNVGIIGGGQATNVVCAEVKIRAEARSRNPEKLRQQVDHMRETFQEAADHYGAQVDFRVTHMYDTYKLSADDPVIRIANRAAEKLGLPTGLREAGGGSDANVFNSFGWPTCVLSTGMRQIHTHQENIEIADLVRNAEWVLGIIAETLAETLAETVAEAASGAASEGQA